MIRLQRFGRLMLADVLLGLVACSIDGADIVPGIGLHELAPIDLCAVPAGVGC